MRCRVLLEGHSFDLDTLTQRFTSGEVMVKRDNDYCYLMGTQINRAATPDDALRQATAQLPWINGIGRASDANYRRVGLAGSVINEDASQSRSVFAEVRIEGRSRLTVGGLSSSAANHLSDKASADRP